MLLTIQCVCESNVGKVRLHLLVFLVEDASARVFGELSAICKSKGYNSMTVYPRAHPCFYLQVHIQILPPPHPGQVPERWGGGGRAEVGRGGVGGLLGWGELRADTAWRVGRAPAFATWQEGHECQSPGHGGRDSGSESSEP